MPSREVPAPVDTAASLLGAVRRRKDPTTHERTLAALSIETLDRVLEDERSARAFWLNVYNAGVQLLLEREPALYQRRRHFFGAERLEVAGRTLSLDDVEHGILRGGHWKYGLGYVPNPLRDSFARRFELPRDARIHFALNCGATSCPPIHHYEPSDLDEQLDVATASYLESTARFDPDRNVARAPRQCLWYRGDFGGRAGIRALLRTHGIVPPDVSPRLRYASYDWHPDPRSFR